VSSCLKSFLSFIVILFFRFQKKVMIPDDAVPTIFVSSVTERMRNLLRSQGIPDEKRETGE
jgi:hypothetical protein